MASDIRGVPHRVKIAAGMALSPNPDPKRGVFETLLVVDGRPIELKAHLARLARSLHELYGADCTEEAQRLIAEAARSLPLGRIRVTGAPDASGKGAIQIKVDTEHVDPRHVLHPDEGRLALRSIAIAGGVGPHKWVDRSLLGQLERKAADGKDGAEAVPLLVDTTGAVLETSRANLFAVRGNVLATPPTDGRILPGIVRGIVCELAPALGLELEESRLAVNELIDADEVFVTSSVRGVAAARSVDGAELWQSGAFSQRVARELAHRWLG